MIGLDTNVLVRFLVRDDEEQHRRAVDLLRRGAEEEETFFVGEVVWVLVSRYRCGRQEIGQVCELRPDLSPTLARR